MVPNHLSWTTWMTNNRGSSWAEQTSKHLHSSTTIKACRKSLPLPTGLYPSVLLCKWGSKQQQQQKQLQISPDNNFSVRLPIHWYPGSEPRYKIKPKYFVCFSNIQILTSVLRSSITWRPPNGTTTLYWKAKGAGRSKEVKRERYFNNNPIKTITH